MSVNDFMRGNGHDDDEGGADPPVFQKHREMELLEKARSDFDEGL